MILFANIISSVPHGVSTLISLGWKAIFVVFALVALLCLADNRFLSILMGRTFSWIDLICYAVGCIAAFGLDQAVRQNLK